MIMNKTLQHITLKYLKKIVLTKHDYINILLISRKKYKGSNKLVNSELYGIIDLNYTVKHLPAIRNSANYDDTYALYISPCPRDIEKASKESIKICIDNIGSLYKLIRSNAQKYSSITFYHHNYIFNN